MNVLLQKEDEKKITSQRELVEYILSNSDNVNEMSEENRRELDARIMAKLKSGKKLSQKELDYLRRTNPILYAEAMRVQRMAEALEEQLKHAKSKEEVNKIFTALSGISKKDPDREYLIASFNRISEEFRKSKAYNELPTTIEEAKKKKKQTDQDPDLFKEDDEDEDQDLKNWSPLQEMFEQMPSFSVIA